MHFDFAEIAGVNGEALLRGDGAQAADQEFASDDDHRHPCRDDAGIQLHQGDEGGGDEQLVGQGVEQHAHGGDLMTAPRQVAVESVGDGGGDEDGRGQQFALAMHPHGEAAAGQDPDQHRNAEDAGERNVVRQVHFRTARCSPQPARAAHANQTGDSNSRLSPYAAGKATRKRTSGSVLPGLSTQAHRQDACVMLEIVVGSEYLPVPSNRDRAQKKIDG